MRLLIFLLFLTPVVFIPAWIFLCQQYAWDIWFTLGAIYQCILLCFSAFFAGRYSIAINGLEGGCCRRGIQIAFLVGVLSCMALVFFYVRGSSGIPEICMIYYLFALFVPFPIEDEI